jgi:hypothetical protein
MIRNQFDDVRRTMEVISKRIIHERNKGQDPYYSRIADEVFHFNSYRQLKAPLSSETVIKICRALTSYGFQINPNKAKVMFSNQRWLEGITNEVFDYKVYLSTAPNQNIDVLKLLLELLNKNGISHNISIAMQEQNTNLIIHLKKYNDVEMIMNFANDYLKDYLTKNVSLIPNYGLVGIIQEKSNLEKSYLELTLEHLYKEIFYITKRNKNRHKFCIYDYYLPDDVIKNNYNNCIGHNLLIIKSLPQYHSDIQKAV